MNQFYSSETASLEKKIDDPHPSIKTSDEDIERVYEVSRCADWIKSNDFKRVCLQFPDHLLPDSTKVALRLKEVLDGRMVYVMADTVYESCCIDYTTAAHVDADAIIHFGPTCTSKTEPLLPHLYVYEKKHLSIGDLYETYRSHFADITENVFILLDTGYIYLLDAIFEKFDDSNASIWPIDHDNLDVKQHITLFVCESTRKITNVKFSLKPKRLFYYNPNEEGKIEEFDDDSRILKRRNFLVEKIKDANTLGIVVGTLAVKNYLRVIERMKKLVDMHGKKYYTISVGKPTVAKLANFPEIDVFVIIGCAMNDVYEQRDFYKPIVTPFDVEFALNPKSAASFSYDFNTFLINDDDIDKEDLLQQYKNDVSLVSGKIRTVSNAADHPSPDDNQTTVSLKSDGTLANTKCYGAGYLSERSWKGLEQNLEQTEASRVEKGRSGTARGYENEPS